VAQRRIELAPVVVDIAELVVADREVADRLGRSELQGLLVGVGGGVEVGQQLRLGPAGRPGLHEPQVVQ
jgi:hypothetical protein